MRESSQICVGEEELRFGLRILLEGAALGAGLGRCSGKEGGAAE